MSANKRISKALSLLIPTGVIGISSALAGAQPKQPLDNSVQNTAVADRLSEIRSAVSKTIQPAENSTVDGKLMLAEWLNFGGGMGWRNGGWGNGGWGNGGWHNWGNGGWHNWGNGWHNWHNFWHNW